MHLSKGVQSVKLGGVQYRRWGEGLFCDGLAVLTNVNKDMRGWCHEENFETFSLL